MKTQAIRACTVGNDKDLFDAFDPEPDGELLAEAKASPNPHFREHLARKVATRNTTSTNNNSTLVIKKEWKAITHQNAFENPASMLRKEISTVYYQCRFSVFCLTEVVQTISKIELHVCAAGDGSGVRERFDIRGSRRTNKEGVLDLDWEYEKEIGACSERYGLGLKSAQTWDAGDAVRSR